MINLGALAYTLWPFIVGSTLLVIGLAIPVGIFLYAGEKHPDGKRHPLFYFMMAAASPVVLGLLFYGLATYIWIIQYISHNPTPQ